MGQRELKRVPLNFDAPLNKVWEGYVNHNERPLECPFCKGCGLNNETQTISDEFYDLHGDGSERWCDNITQDEVEVLVSKNRLVDFTHTWEKGNSWKRREDEYIPTAQEVNEWNKHGFGHDAINRWILVEARAKRLGVYGKCDFCKGKGEIFRNKDVKKKYDSWKMKEPPVGEGYQLWETCSEGSPISPVFDNIESLAEWCEKNATTFGSEKTTRENWLKMLRDENKMWIGSTLIKNNKYLGSGANEKTF